MRKKCLFLLLLLIVPATCKGTRRLHRGASTPGASLSKWEIALSSTFVASGSIGGKHSQSSCMLTHNSCLGSLQHAKSLLMLISLLTVCQQKGLCPILRVFTFNPRELDFPLLNSALLSSVQTEMAVKSTKDLRGVFSCPHRVGTCTHMHTHTLGPDVLPTQNIWKHRLRNLALQRSWINIIIYGQEVSS